MQHPFWGSILHQVSRILISLATVATPMVGVLWSYFSGESVCITYSVSSSDSSVGVEFCMTCGNLVTLEGQTQMTFTFITVIHTCRLSHSFPFQKSVDEDQKTTPGDTVFQWTVWNFSGTHDHCTHLWKAISVCVFFFILGAQRNRQTAPTADGPWTFTPWVSHPLDPLSTPPRPAVVDALIASVAKASEKPTPPTAQKKASSPNEHVENNSWKKQLEWNMSFI